MATITLEYNPRNAMVQKTLNYILSLGLFKVKSTKEASENDPEMVKIIQEAHQQEGGIRLTSMEEIHQFCQQ